MDARRFGIIVALFLQPLPGSAQDQPVTAKEIQDTWVGKTLVGANVNGFDLILNLAADGTASVRSGRTYDTGTWRVSDEGYCVTWRKIRLGKEACFTVKRSGTRMVVTDSDGAVSGYFTEVK